MDTNRPKYRPLFLEHFEKKEVNHLNVGTDTNGTLPHLRLPHEDDIRRDSEDLGLPSVIAFQKALTEDGNFEFLSFLSESELEARMATLDAEMEAEIEQLRARYTRKRQPILDAMRLKRTRQQNF